MERILTDRAEYERALEKRREANQELEARLDGLEEQKAGFAARLKELNEKLPEAEAEVRELVGFIRQNARNLDTLLHQSPQGAFDRSRETAFLAEIAENRRFPSMDDLYTMLNLLVEETQRSGQVQRAAVPVVDRSGAEVSANVFLVGNFQAFGEVNGETDFFTYSPPTGRFFQLSRPSPESLRGALADYMKGASGKAPVDTSRGAALRQLVHRLDWKEQVRAGGPIVWPILAIAALAAILVAERLVFLLRVRTNTERLMSEVVDLAGKNDWDACAQACERRGDRPVPRVLMAGIGCRHMCREDMENVLSEAILREIPRIERFLPTLGMLAAIAPLLGLLGTVTGMINTFHVITFAGTGDPRLMSGGISEALVTTMLGLGVAIPVTVAHTLLSRMGDRIVGQMEEKGMALVNEVTGARSAT
ncbi:MAG: MotA/TolQ/ExbB proton channel family protein [Desulfatibacillaceae bacterium]